MKTEKKLIAYSAIALLIGVASIAPLLFLMSGTANAETTVDKPWFSLNVPYAYWTANATENPNGTVTYREWYIIGFNLTLNPEAAKQVADARIEYYQMQIYTDKAPIENLTYFVGTNRTDAFDSIESIEASFHFVRDNWFDTNTSGGGMFGGNFSGNEMMAISGSTSGLCPSSNWSNSTISQRIANIENANTIYIDIRRLGSVTFNGNSTVATLSSNDVLQHIELTKTNNGFVYGTTTNLNVPFPIEGPSTTQQTPSNVTIPNPSISQGLGSTNQP